MILAAFFTVLLDGKPVPDAEICIAKGRDFAVAPFTCAKGDIALPAGEWTAFARHGSDRVSDASVTTTQELRLVRAVPADVASWPAGEGESRFVYLPRSRSVLPVLDRVPVDTLVIPVTVKDGAVVAVGESSTVGRLRVTPSPAVVVPVTIEKAPLGRSQPPIVTLTDGSGKVHEPVAPLSSSIAGTELVFFRGVAGKVTANLTGERWKSATATLEATAPAGTLGKPLATTATSKLIVNWWLGNDPAVLTRTVHECKARESGFDRSRPGTRFHFVLKQCLTRECSPIAERALPPDQARGIVELEDIPAGRYRMEIEYPGLETLRKSVDITAEEVTRADFEARWFTFFGKVTRGAKPTHVRVFGTVSDPESGEYHAVVDRQPSRDSTESAIFCDGSQPFHFVLDDPPAENARFDIEIPSNRLPVEVVDATTGLPVPRPHVSLAALFDGQEEGTAHFAGFGRLADEKGRVDLGPVLANRRLIVCARHDDYLRRCSDPFRMKGIEEKAFRLELQRAEKRSGRVIVNGSVDAGMVMIFGPDGRMSERLVVKPDGTFSMQKPHAAGEIFAFISRSHPLYVFTLQRPVGETFEVRPPAGPLRTFEVIRARTATEVGFFTFAMGDLIVPGQVLSDYVVRRGGQPSLPPGAVVVVPDVVVTGPISVIFIPRSYVESRTGRGDLVLGFPEGRSLPRQLLGDRTSVSFD